MEVEPVPCCSATSAERSGAVRARLSSTCRWPGADPAQFPPNSSWTPAVRQESIRPGAPSALLVQQAAWNLLCEPAFILHGLEDDCSLGRAGLHPPAGCSKQ
ncbi:uncharacterized protein LOC110432416 isoform X5 [Sorghum bicolor]|uniref:uncharacterized protein LOC110432416 isoform X5 n=1 Tax=Sorghum bicolor TaxID=4558 RepID=UPI000B424F7F|nr:uncharacterized protein LOC110432416 isoform X5 [Sorghum bicolor]|eukprot:XP_021308477.1 uncharacterized protein LOC110432416 isoform X5 [Sorghum bicolor]